MVPEPSIDNIIELKDPYPSHTRNINILNHRKAEKTLCSNENKRVQFHEGIERKLANKRRRYFFPLTNRDRCWKLNQVPGVTNRVGCSRANTLRAFRHWQLRGLGCSSRKRSRTTRRST